jgi:hypothetical protein
VVRYAAQFEEKPRNTRGTLKEKEGDKSKMKTRSLEK